MRKNMQSMQKKVALCILDGWGVNSKPTKGDATQVASYFQELWQQYPHKLLRASGQSVGLPKGQVGNSEVGHTTLGLGRVINQDLCRINEAISQKNLCKNGDFQQFFTYLKEKKSAAHVLGLLSPGGVHSHIDHMIAVINLLTDSSIPVYIHAILDGRDTPPRSAYGYLNQLQKNLSPLARIVSLCGRFNTMDRDKRWERTEDAYRLIAEQQGYLEASSYEAVFENDYYQSTSDEFIEPIVIGEKYEENNDDGLIMINFRADRARQIMRALGDPDFDVFSRKTFPRFSKILSMTEYDEAFQSFCTPLFRKESVKNSLGQVLELHHKRQVRIAETEKYAHVTFFFNGGLEASLKNEERIVVPSPKVQTYDQYPEMSAEKVTHEFIKAMNNDHNDVVVVNYANADMLGHTGNLVAAEQSIKFVDECLKHVVKAAIENHYMLFITADHGNAEQMLNPDGSAHTAHTTNFVPFLAINLQNSYNILENEKIGSLADVAPTILESLNLEKPLEMTGYSLIGET